MVVGDSLCRDAGWERRQLVGRSRVPEPLLLFRVVHAGRPELYHTVVAWTHSRKHTLKQATHVDQKYRRNE